MADNIHNLPVNRPATLAEQWRKSLADKPTAGEAVALLTSCLALVRPVGFSDENAKDWLRVAAPEVAYIPRDILNEACRHARRVCDHHSKILPAIIAKADAEISDRRRHVQKMAEYTQEALPKQESWQPTADELAALKAEIKAHHPSNRGDASA